MLLILNDCPDGMVTAIHGSMKSKIVVKRTGRTWSIFRNGVLVEGGFFSQLVAEHAAREWENNTK